jgi:hypothetical protein
VSSHRRKDQVHSTIGENHWDIFWVPEGQLPQKPTGITLDPLVSEVISHRSEDNPDASEFSDHR